jgi:oxygen-independent coproporphyrinogen-3 oxidase
LITLIYDESELNPVYMSEMARTFDGYLKETVTIRVECTLAGLRASADSNAVAVPIKENHRGKTAKYAVYLLLSELTGIRLPWGSMTGVKPLKKMHQLLDTYEADDAAIPAFFQKTYDISDVKTDLMLQTAINQRPLLDAQPHTAGLYVHVPLCVSKCTYCSFPSMVTPEGSDLCETYLQAILKECDALRGHIEDRGLRFDNVYFGGGTPSVFSEEQLAIFLGQLSDWLNQADEVTFEAGRSDTLSEKKLKVLKEHGVERISLNPQTTNDKTLQAINRKASYADFLRCFAWARDMGFEVINCDLILGLDGEDEIDFRKSLNDVLALAPENITLHTLCCKRTASTEQQTIFEHTVNVSAFHDEARGILAERGYLPYYLYKQKYAVSGGENVGYALPGTECVYNVRMMGETQSIYAVGAGSSTKLCACGKDMHENIYTIKDVQQYIQNIDDVIARKLEKIKKTEASFSD